MFLHIHLVKYSHRMHAKADCRTPNIECRTNQTVLLHKFIAKMASNLPCVQKFRKKFLPDEIPDVVAYSFSNVHLLNACKSWLSFSKNWMQNKPNCLLRKLITKMASNLPCVQKFRNKFLPDVVPDIFAHSFA